MELAGLELWVVELPLKTPFASSAESLTTRRSLILRLDSDAGPGWGECVAFEAPFYTSEYLTGAAAAITELCWPLLRGVDVTDAARSGELMAPIKGHPMAKAALEMALLDAELRASGQSLASRLGATRDRVEVGVAVGLHADIADLLTTVATRVAEGYRRVKLKIEPGRDIEPVAAVRAEFGPDLMLQVDANGAYTPRDLSPLVALDPFDLLLIEQPFDPEDLLGHARLEAAIETSVCLDESVTSLATAAQALELGACSSINLKPGRVGGYLEAVRIHDYCVTAGIPLWCGGMLEMGLGRAGNLALASLPGFTLPGDISATSRYFETDITDEFELVAGTLAAPTGAGLGVEPDREKLDRFGALTATLT